jgi:5-methylcytosine-specific restriction endonuclease McrA
MARRLYDRFMVHTKIGSNRKLRRLKPNERWCHVAGVLAIAAESPTPGHLFIADGLPATDRDIAEHAGVSLAVARSTVEKLHELGILQMDEDGDCVFVHDWDEWNQPPKSDPGAAERMRRRRARLRENGQTGNVPEKVRYEVFARDGHRCLACDAKDNLEVDHITPVVAGGTHDKSNLGTLCRTCNRMKGVRLLFGENGHVTVTRQNGAVRQEGEGEDEGEVDA